MNEPPDFSHKGYRVLRQLGHNSLGGRVTYQVERCCDSPEGGLCQRTLAVLKQFQFAQSESDWSGFQAHEAETQALQQLNHPGIPKYLDSFETPQGFCLVQEYKAAPSLAEPRSWQPHEIQQIAQSILEILVYLQAQPSPAIHRDLKPENILVDEQLNVYLVDFGFARLDIGSVAISSLVKGTLGFMPPEQLFNHQLTTASDLYGLGVTLICLLTGIRSADAGDLVDADYRLQFRQLMPPLQRGWVMWLERLVEPNPQDRYSSAAQALEALKTIDFTRLPKLRLSCDAPNWGVDQCINLKAKHPGEMLHQTVNLSNPIPQTLLTGWWEIAPDASAADPDPDGAPWVAVQPQRFQGNQLDCDLFIDTQQLSPNRTYTQRLLLHTNATAETEVCTLAVTTTAAPVPAPYIFLGLTFVLFCTLGVLLMARNPVTFWASIAFILAGFTTTEHLLRRQARERLPKRYQRFPLGGAFLGQVGGVLLGLTLSAFAYWQLLQATVTAIPRPGLTDWLLAEGWGAIASPATAVGAAIGALLGSGIVARRYFPAVKRTLLLLLLVLLYYIGHYLGSVWFLLSTKPTVSALELVTILITGLLPLSLMASLDALRSTISTHNQQTLLPQESTTSALVIAGLGLLAGAGVGQLIALRLVEAERASLSAAVGGAIASTTFLALLLFLGTRSLWQQSRQLARYRRRHINRQRNG